GGAAGVAGLWRGGGRFKPQSAQRFHTGQKGFFGGGEVVVVEEGVGRRWWCRKEEEEGLLFGVVGLKWLVGDFWVCPNFREIPPPLGKIFSLVNYSGQLFGIYFEEIGICFITI
ncbi:MAG: hypothetical protein LBT53_07165, partial [Puniceicoccales bacterium]|nr:hypothetical protein [Puniceicoccales bacterium]